MAKQFVNPTVQPVGAGGSPIANAVSGILGAYGGTFPDPKEQSVVDYNKAKTMQAQQELAVPNALQAIVERVYNAQPDTVTQEAPRPDSQFQGPMPAETKEMPLAPVEDRLRAEMPGLVKNMAAAGKPGDVANLFLGLMANAPGASTDTSKGPSAVDMAMLGKGEPFGSTISGTREKEAGDTERTRITQQGALDRVKATEATKNQAKLDETTKGKQDFEAILSDMSGLYDKLEQQGSAVSGNNDFLTNKVNQLAGSDGVFGIGGAALSRGSKGQNVRDEITAKRQLLFAKLKQAAGLSAQQLNSNVELMSYLKSLTDPTGEIGVNRGIIKQLSRQFGTGTFAADAKPAGAAPAADGSDLSKLSDEDLMKMYQQRQQR